MTEVKKTQGPVYVVTTYYKDGYMHDKLEVVKNEAELATYVEEVRKNVMTKVNTRRGIKLTVFRDVKPEEVTFS